jgi:hypothetical protein
MLNPRMKDVNMDQILHDSLGHGAKILAKRRINMISGNMNSCARLLNSKEQLDKTVEATELAAIIGEMRADAEEDMQQKQWVEG